MTAIERLRAILEAYPDAKLGFVIYRCTYVDDTEWEDFMAYLNASTQRQLDDDGIGDLFRRIDWNVQEDPRLNGASKEDIRQEFRKWIEEGGEINHATPRHHACVMVDQECIDSALKHAPPPEEFDRFGVGWVYLISSMNEGRKPGYDSDYDEDEDEDNEEGDEDEEDNEEKEDIGEEKGERGGKHGEGEDNKQEELQDEENEGPRDKLFYTRVGISYLVPRVYTMLDGSGWHNFAGVDGSVAVP